MRKKNKKNLCKLLPYKEEKIYGLNASSCQMFGWQIVKFNIDSNWIQYTGKNIKVAIIDTGCDLNHEDIKNNLIEGYNFIDNSNYPEDDNGHGTHVAGIVAASNNKKGIVGVAPDTKILPIKVLDSEGNGDNELVAKSIVWAVDRSSDIITMSLGSIENSKDVYSAIKYAIKNNVLVFCAAGNMGLDHPVLYPAKYDETIAIGSINEDLKISEFTCFGEELDFLSPGENILSCVPKNNYSIMSGTSMSNPFAVGCASLYLDFCNTSGISKPKNRKEFLEIFYKHNKKLNGKVPLIQPVISQL
jgi:major intracellular serine protease